MLLKWRYLLIGVLIGFILGGLLSFIVIRTPSNRTLILLPSPLPSAGERLSDESINVNEGKINLNKATIDELASLPGIGSVKAQAIVEFREKYGAYQGIDELLYVPGIGKSLLADIRDLIYVD